MIDNKNNINEISLMDENSFDFLMSGVKNEENNNFLEKLIFNNPSNENANTSNQTNNSTNSFEFQNASLNNLQSDSKINFFEEQNNPFSDKKNDSIFQNPFTFNFEPFQNTNQSSSFNNTNNNSTSSGSFSYQNPFTFHGTDQNENTNSNNSNNTFKSIVHNNQTLFSPAPQKNFFIPKLDFSIIKTKGGKKKKKQMIKEIDPSLPTKSKEKRKMHNIDPTNLQKADYNIFLDRIIERRGAKIKNSVCYQRLLRLLRDHSDFFWVERDSENNYYLVYEPENVKEKFKEWEGTSLPHYERKLRGNKKFKELNLKTVKTTHPKRNVLRKKTKMWSIKPIEDDSEN